jgi:thiamine biosynthesis lipoprotein
MIAVEQIMGMPIVVDVRDDGVDDGVLAPVFDWFRWVDAVFSTYRRDSQISRFNRGELAFAHLHPDVLEVLRRCDELRGETDGYFDVHAASPHEVDPSGLVKGWSVDRAAALLERAGVRNYAVNAGGDTRVSGRAAPELCWRVGIQHPVERHKLARVLETGQLAVATSGEYARGAHVLDPHTHRRPSGRILSVTITGPDLATADAYATAAFAMGPARALRWTARLRGYEALTILADGRMLSTPGFPSAG